MINPDFIISKDGRSRGELFGSRFCDEYGRPVQRTKYTHPYSYDGYVIWKSSDYKPQSATGTIYSDRLYQWDYEKAIALSERHQIQRWDNTPPERIEAFLRDWNDAPDLHLMLVMEYCDLSSGYPCWRFDYVSTESQSEKKANG